MKNFLLIGLVSFAVLLLGCGGGGGGGSSTTGTPAANVKLLAFNGNTVVDATNLQVGDSVTFKLGTIDASGNFTNLNAGGFSTNDSGHFAGPFSSSGVFTAQQPTPGNTYTASVFYGSVVYKAFYAVQPTQPRLTGTVVDANGSPVPLATVQFYDNSLNLVRTCTTGLDGSLNASVPTSAVRFNIDPNTLPIAQYYRLFDYGTGTYNPLVGGSCAAPVPSLNAGTNSLPNQVVVQTVYDRGGALVPPPPPASCTP